MKTTSTGFDGFFLKLGLCPSLSFQIEYPQIIEISDSFSSEND
jgi:hypothetical protein